MLWSELLQIIPLLNILILAGKDILVSRDFLFVSVRIRLFAPLYPAVAEPQSIQEEQHAEAGDIGEH